MENILGNKARFFAQYLNQPVAIITKGSYSHPKDTIHVVDEDTISSVQSEKFVKYKYSLELKPLSSISDEDAIEVAKIVCREMFINFKTGHHVDRIEIDAATVKHPRSARTVDINYAGSVDKYDEETGFMYNPYMAHAIDYLRSKGYALPWMDLSVEEQVSYGWVKLKGE